MVMGGQPSLPCSSIFAPKALRAWSKGLGAESCECGSGNVECGKKKKSEFGSLELKHSVERTEVRRQRTEVGRWEGGNERQQAWSMGHKY